MVRRVALLLLLPLAVAAQPATESVQADGQLVGRLAGHPAVLLLPDGSLTISVPSPLPLDNGRMLELRDGRWRLVPESESDATEISALDLAAYWDDYVGRRIRLARAPLYGSTIKGAILRLPGTFAQLEYGAMPRDQIKYLLEHCAGAVPSPRCAVAVTATVAGHRVVDGWPLLVEPVIEVGQ